MDMKVLKAAGNKAEALISIGRGFTSFINVNEGEIGTLRQAFGKPLDTVTDADVDEYFGITLTKEQRTSAKAILTVCEDLIQIVKPIKDKLPANDIEG